MKLILPAFLIALSVLIGSCSSCKDTSNNEKPRTAWFDNLDLELKNKINLDKDIYYCVYKSDNKLTLVNEKVLNEDVLQLQLSKLTASEKAQLDSAKITAINSNKKIADVTGINIGFFTLIKLFKDTEKYVIYDASKNIFIEKIFIMDKGYNRGPLQAAQTFELKIDGVRYFFKEIMS